MAANDDIEAAIAEIARGRRLVIDFKVSPCHGVPVGDPTVQFRTDGLEPRYVEIEAISGVRILVERHLIERVAGGARLEWHRGLLVACSGSRSIDPSYGSTSWTPTRRTNDQGIARRAGPGTLGLRRSGPSEHKEPAYA